MLNSFLDDSFVVPVTRNCKQCGEAFPLINIRKIFCSQKCCDKRLLKNSCGPRERSCKLCGKAFTFISSKKIFCSKRCAIGTLPESDRNCDHCGRTFKTSNPVKLFCSKKCNVDSWWKRNPDRGRELTLRYRSQNKEKLREQHRALRIAKAEEIREYNRAYHQRNADAVHARQSSWKKAHPEAGYAANRKRRARKIGAQGSHTGKEFELICKKQNYKCAHCGEKKKLSADHIMPISKGGSNFAFNLMALCGSCNSAKHNKILPYAHPSLFDTR